MQWKGRNTDLQAHFDTLLPLVPYTSVGVGTTCVGTGVGVVVVVGIGVGVGVDDASLITHGAMDVLQTRPELMMDLMQQPLAPPSLVLHPVPPHVPHDSTAIMVYQGKHQVL